MPKKVDSKQGKKRSSPKKRRRSGHRIEASKPAVKEQIAALRRDWKRGADPVTLGTQILVLTGKAHRSFRGLGEQIRKPESTLRRYAMLGLWHRVLPQVRSKVRRLLGRPARVPCRFWTRILLLCGSSVSEHRDGVAGAKGKQPRSLCPHASRAQRQLAERAPADTRRGESLCVEEQRARKFERINAR